MPDFRTYDLQLGIGSGLFCRRPGWVTAIESEVWVGSEPEVPAIFSLFEGFGSRGAIGARALASHGTLRRGLDNQGLSTRLQSTPDAQ